MVKEEERIDKAEFCEVLVKRQQNSGKAELCEDGVKPARKAAAGGRIAGSIAAKQESRNPKGSGKKRQKEKRQPQTEIGMVEKEGRQASRQMAENNIPRGKAQKATPARRKGYY